MQDADALLSADVPYVDREMCLQMFEPKMLPKGVICAAHQKGGVGACVVSTAGAFPRRGGGRSPPDPPGAGAEAGALLRRHGDACRRPHPGGAATVADAWTLDEWSGGGNAAKTYFLRT